MSVISGVLQEISEGSVIPTGTGRWVSRTTYGGYGATVTREQKNPLGGWTRHAFVDVGETRIPRVLVRPIHEQLLRVAIGQEVQLSVSKFGKGHRIEAINTPKDGVVKTPLGLMVIGMISALGSMFIALVGLAIFGLIFWGVAGWILSSLVGHKTVVSLALLAAVAVTAVWLVWGTTAGIVKTWVAWAAL